MKNENKKRKEMRGLLIFIFLLILANFIFNLSLPHYVWIVLFIIVSILSVVQLLDSKLRHLDKRIKILEKDNNLDEY